MKKFPINFMYDEFDFDEIKKRLDILVQILTNLNNLIDKYESKYNIKYSQSNSTDLYNRYRILLERIDKGEKVT